MNTSQSGRQTYPTTSHQAATQQPGELTPVEDIWEYAKEYSRAKPEVVAMWCFGIGFILGWKLKPW